MILEDVVNYRKVTVSTGKNRKDTNWKVRSLDWSDMVNKLATPHRTHETVLEYSKMSKDDKGSIKDVGGFVGGVLQGGRRTSESVAWRELITLDADYATWDMLDKIVDLNCECCVYSTHSHTKEKPRFRLVIPLSKAVTSEEYGAVSRKVAETVGMDYFDDTTYESNRLMYWPSCSIDGEYFFKRYGGEWLDSGEWLGKYSDWRNRAEWPESSRTVKERQKLADKQGDPTAKEGIVGAWCRTYGIAEVIDKYLGDVYERCEAQGKGRYTYTGGSTAGGFVVYDNTFGYSHHESDPCSGRLCNAWDLVRLHKYSDMTEAEGNKLMTTLALGDSEVVQTIGEERLAEAGVCFDDEVSVEWLSKMEVNKAGAYVESLKNYTLILENDNSLSGIAYNELIDAIVIVKSMPWRGVKEWHGELWHDDDECALRSYISTIYGLWSPIKLRDVIVSISRKRSFHPIKKYLESLPAWDGIERVDSLFIDYLGAEDNIYVRESSRKMLCACIERVYNPGCKHDQTVVFSGTQGIGKSTLFSRLGKNWYNDSLTMSDMGSKSAAEKLQGYWILEISELAGMKKMDVETIKGFLSRQKDVYRPAYGRYIVEKARRCVIVGSTNNVDGFLRDNTGNRRFLPIQCSGNGAYKPWDMNAVEVDQIWAESYINWMLGEKLIISKEAELIADVERIEAGEADDREGIVREYIDTLLPVEWDDMSLADRRRWLDNDFGTEGIIGTVKRKDVCTMEIWCEVFRKNKEDLQLKDSYAIASILRKIGCNSAYNSRRVFGIYGRQRSFVLP